MRLGNAAVVLVWLTCSSCGGSAVDGDGGTAADASQDAPVDAWMPPDGWDCHHDCFGHFDCAGGVVTEYIHAPIPCEDWAGECPSWAAVVCTMGCLVDFSRLDNPFADPRVLCAETPPKGLGDQCNGSADCLPTPAVLAPDGGVVNTYLQCDGTLDECVAADPAVIPYYMSPCPGDLGSIVGQSETRRIDGSCPSGFCLARDDAALGCLASGCTASCNGDEDCPPGSTCDTFAPGAPGGEIVPGCRPGWHGTPVLLACP